MDTRGFSWGHALLLALLAAAAAAVLLPGRTVREEPGDVLRALRSSRGPSLPPHASVGASSATAPMRYARDTLYEAIDGAAEGYLARGFTAAAMTTYAFGGAGGGFEISAEAHRFATEAGARAQAEAERPRRAAAVPDVPGAVSDGAVLLAVAGRDLLKLTLLAPSERGAAALAAVAAAWRRETGP